MQVTVHLKLPPFKFKLSVSLDLANYPAGLDRESSYEIVTAAGCLNPLLPIIAQWGAKVLNFTV